MPGSEKLDCLARRVSSKHEGDFAGAVRLSALTDTFAGYNSATVSALQTNILQLILNLGFHKNQLQIVPLLQPHQMISCQHCVPFIKDQLEALMAYSLNLQDLTSPSAEAGGRGYYSL